MANTYDADLCVDRLSEKAILVLQERLAPLRAFSRDFGTDTLRPRATVQVEKSGTHATAQQNPTNYESGDTTNDAVAVTVNEETISFNVSSQEMMQGERLETKAGNNLHGLADNIWDEVVALCNDANSDNDIITCDQASFTDTQRQALWASIAKGGERHLILDATAYAENLPSDKNAFELSQRGAYGFDGFHLATKWDATGAEDDLYGLAVTPNAFAVASGLPEISPAVANNLEAVGTAEIPDLGLTVQTCLWGSTSTRATWISYGVMFGVSVGDGTAFTLVVSS